MDDGYVEFMTECNGQPVLCRVKVPIKDAKVHENNSNSSNHNINNHNINNHNINNHNINNHNINNHNHNNNNRSSSVTPSFVTQSRRTNFNPRYHQHQHHANDSNKTMTTRTHSPVVQKRYHPSSPSTPRHYSYHPRQGQYQYNLSSQYQHPHKPYQSPLSTMNGRNLNPDAPVWTGSWQNSH
ncbi:hypothetical protein BCR42DRAFT_416855 [Absidia repens]|uniref:Uncharacterized protein n=1 Tax=Absidia repens TaxID=90262 RepID=A0A1X2IFD8_9FUNG|nr:hypothetical protein BCR42DRAFT_416855 [Absidia repens]